MNTPAAQRPNLGHWIFLVGYWIFTSALPNAPAATNPASPPRTLSSPATNARPSPSAPTPAPPTPDEAAPWNLYHGVARELDARRFSRAATRATELLEQYPDFKEAYRARAYANYEQRAYADAETDILEFRERLGEDRYDIFVMLGRIQIAQTNYAGAVESFEAVRQLKPSTPNIYLSLGRLYGQLGDYARSEERLVEAVEKEPRHVQSEAARLLEGLRRHQRPTPPHGKEFLGRAQLYMEQGDIEKALQELEHWAKKVRDIKELHRVEQDRVFELLYNQSQYRNLIKDIRSRLDPTPGDKNPAESTRPEDDPKRQP